MKELLEEIISKFNECKAEGLNYHTYKDKALTEAVEKAEAFLKGDEPKEEIVSEEAEPFKKSKGKK